MNYRSVIIPLVVIGLSLVTSSNHQQLFAQVDLQKLPNSSTNVDTGHNSRNSLDWNGVYKGILPCGDCEGIQTSIRLYGNGTYIMETEYLGKDEQTFVTKGEFSWNQAGGRITLNNVEDAPNQYIVGENRLIQLDDRGNVITGGMADNYILDKLTKTERSLTDTRWELVEIMGQEVTRDIFIKFNGYENIVSGFNSCNSFRGGYEATLGNRLIFQEMMATMKICPEMGNEGQFMDILRKIDNYAIKDDVLTFHKARMAPLLKFVAVEEVEEK